MADRVTRAYGSVTPIDFELWQQDGSAVQDTWTPAVGEVQLMDNEAAFGNVTNLPVHEGNGVWSWTPAANELDGARLVLTIRDAGTDVLDKTIVINTVGNASAQFPDADGSSFTALPLHADWQDGGRLDLLLDAIPTTAMRGTDNAALASLVTAARMGALTDLIDGGRLDLLLDTLVAELTAGRSEIASVPAADVDMGTKIDFMFALMRNKITNDGSTQTLRNDADDGNIGTAAVDETTGTVTRDEWA